MTPARLLVRFQVPLTKDGRELACTTALNAARMADRPGKGPLARLATLALVSAGQVPLHLTVREAEAACDAIRRLARTADQARDMLTAWSDLLEDEIALAALGASR